MKQRYKWEVRVGGVLHSQGREETEWVELKQRNDDTKVEGRETASECIREGNYTADNPIFPSAAILL